MSQGLEGRGGGEARRTLALSGVMTGLFLGAIESTVVSAAMPTIVVSLGGLTIYSWVFSAYLLTSTVTVPLWGRLSDLYGRRRLYLSGIALFLLGSALSGFSRSMAQLVAFRAVQGLGAGALLPIGLTIVGELYPLEERAKKQGFLSGVWGVASIIGPILGGSIADHLSWRWVFFLNLPFGFLAAFLVELALKGAEGLRREKVSVDYAGAAALTTSIALLLLALMRGTKHFQGSITFGMVTLSFFFLGLFLHLEGKASEPLVPLSLFANRIFRSASLSSFLAGMAMFGAIVYIPLFVQGVLGTSAVQAGSVLTPFMLGWVTCSVVGARLLLQVGYRPTVLLGTGLLAFSFFLLTRMGLEATWGGVALNVTIAGAGMGFIMAPLLIAVQNAVPRNLLGIATSASMFFRTIGGAIGVAAMGAVMGIVMQGELSALSRSSPTEELRGLLTDPDALVHPETRARLSLAALNALKTVLGVSLHAVFLMGFWITLLAFLSAWWIPKGKAQDHVRRESPPEEPA